MNIGIFRRQCKAFGKMPNIQPEIVSDDPPQNAVFFDGGMLLISRNGEVALFNASAAALWKDLALGNSLQSHARLISATFGLDHSNTVHALEHIFTEWEKLGCSPKAAAGSAKHFEAKRPRAHVSQEPLSSFTGVFGKAGFCITLPEPLKLLLWPLIGGFACDVGAPDSTLLVNSCSDGSFEVAVNTAEPKSITSEAALTGFIFQTLLEFGHGTSNWTAILHGSAVAKNNRAVIFSGPSGSGKSTLAAWLSTQGWHHLADDLAAVTLQNQVLSWPVPVSLKPGGFAVLADALIEAGAEMPLCPVEVSRERTAHLVKISAGPYGDPAQVAALIFPVWQDNGEYKLIRLPTHEVIARLISDNAFIGHPLTIACLQRFVDWCKGTPAYTMQYSQFQDAEAGIEALLLA